VTRKRDKAPAPIVRLTGGRLSPVSAWDAELLSDYPHGTEFDLVARTKRSNPHNRMYRAQLSQIVKATGAYPTPVLMHRWIKHRLGYTEPVFDPNGNVVAVVLDSTAFDEMDQAAFMRFYEQVVQLVAAEMGIDMGALCRT
jgi:hypothetical protein